MEFSPLLLCLLGTLLIFIEIFFVPGFGLIGILGFSLLLWGTYRYSVEYGVWTASFIFLAALAVCTSAFVVFFRSPASKWIVHRDTLQGDTIQKFVNAGQRGRSVTPLYPTGKSIFVVDGKERMLDVSSSGEFIDTGEEIEVFMVEGSRIFVKAVSRKVV